MFASRRIAREMGLSHPPSRREIISYMFSRPLCFAPGTRSAYSNFGYAVLGTIVENRTGMDFDTYVDSAILDPIDADLRPGHTLPADRYPREVWYGDWEFSPSAVDVDALVPVRRPDGGFYLEAMDANSGYVATARDLLRVLDTFWLSGEPRCEVPFAPGAIYGALSGTYALAYQPTPSIDVVVLCNRFPTEPWALARRIRDSLPGAGRAIGPHPVA
jgi:N-acyl-D-amino-acid deacylase